VCHLDHSTRPRVCDAAHNGVNRSGDRMKLTLKIILLFLLVVCGLVGVSGYLSVEREIAFFEDEMTARHGRLVTAVEPMLRDAWRSAGRGGMLQFVARIEGDEQQVRIRWVWLDETADEATRPFAPQKSLSEIPRGRPTSVRVRADNGLGLYCSYFPVELGDGRRGALELTESLIRRDEYTRSTIRRTILLLGEMIIAAMLLVAIFGLRLIGQPLQALIEKTRQVADGDLRTPVTVSGSDELATLAMALNQMCEKLDASQQAVQRESAQRIEALEQLRHGDRLRTVGRLASGVAHELGTPLNVVSGRADLIASGNLSREDVIKSAAAIQTEATRMTGLVRQLLNFARRSTPNRMQCNLNSVIELTISLMEPIIRKKEAHVEVTQKLPDDVRLRADSAQIQQVLSNLLMNAILSKDADVNVQIAAEVCQAVCPEEANSEPILCVRIRVTDDGDGIAESDLPHVFEPFFTTRDVGQGTGLGLSIADGIVAEHGGWMTVDSLPGKGTTFAVFLPADMAS
jgi:two-component system NtrC family sensor kinase